MEKIVQLILGRGILLMKSSRYHTLGIWSDEGYNRWSLDFKVCRLRHQLSFSNKSFRKQLHQIRFEIPINLLLRSMKSHITDEKVIVEKKVGRFLIKTANCNYNWSCPIGKSVKSFENRRANGIWRSNFAFTSIHCRKRQWNCRGK